MNILESVEQGQDVYYAGFQERIEKMVNGVAPEAQVSWDQDGTAHISQLDPTQLKQLALVFKKNIQDDAEFASTGEPGSYSVSFYEKEPTYRR